MRFKTVVLVAALVGAGCSPSTSKSSPRPTDGPVGSGGAGGVSPPPATGGSTGSGGAQTVPGTGGGTGGEGSATPDATVSTAVDAAAPSSSPDGPSAPTGGGGMTGGSVLYVGGDKPLVGADGLIHDALKAKGVMIEDVNFASVTPAMASMADGRRLVVLSYSLQSGGFAATAAAMAGTKSPMLVLEHNLLPVVGMTDDAGHGFTGGGTITIIGNDPVLTAGLPMGDLNVYTPAGKEMFWGVPGPGAIKVATAKGAPNHFVYFAYPAGAMMASKPAPGKRMLFLVASHAPPPVTDQFLNPDGLKLLAGAVEWLLQ